MSGTSPIEHTGSRTSSTEALADALGRQSLASSGFVESFSILADADGGVVRLRELVLTLAFSGCLLEATVSSSDAAQRLIAELVAAAGARRRRKTTADLEELESGPLVQLPIHWGQVALADIATLLVDGSHNPPKDVGPTGIPMLSGQNIRDGQLTTDASRYISEADYLLESQRAPVQPGDVLLSIVGSIGRSAVLPNGFPRCGFQRSAAIIRTGLYPEYLSYYLRSPEARAYYALHAKGTAQLGIYLGRLGRIVVPVPPLAEQKRIVARVDELMALCDELEAKQAKKRDTGARLTKSALDALTAAEGPEEFEAAWKRVVENFDVLIDRAEKVGELRNAVLEMAFTGRLVRRLASDAAVAALLESIDAGWNKRSRKEVLPAVESDEVRIGPSHWTWVRLGNLAQVVGGVAKGRALEGRTCISLPYLRVANVQRGFLDLAQIKEIEIADHELPKYRLMAGDILFTEGGDWDKLGRSAVWANQIEPCIHQNHVFRARLVCSELDPAWVSSFANSPVGRAYFESAAKRTTNLASINMRQLRHCPIPLPPAEEKARIVEKVQQLMQLCDELEAKLRRAEECASRSATAMTAELTAR